MDTGQRPLLLRRHHVRDAHRRAPVCCGRPFGMGPLPHRTSTGGASGLSRNPAACLVIIMRLLAKNAEDRYQTAVGPGRSRSSAVPSRCGRRMAASISFLLGADDLSDRLLIPEKLYGRSGRLILCLRRSIVSSPAAKAGVSLLVSGYSGVGKTLVVHELLQIFGSAPVAYAASWQVRSVQARHTVCHDSSGLSEPYPLPFWSKALKPS